jgi:hypothetical protein
MDEFERKAREAAKEKRWHGYEGPFIDGALWAKRTHQECGDCAEKLKAAYEEIAALQMDLEEYADTEAEELVRMTREALGKPK